MRPSSRGPSFAWVGGPVGTAWAGPGEGRSTFAGRVGGRRTVGEGRSCWGKSVRGL